MLKETFYTVPQLSKELNVTERTIRFYDSKGLLNPSRVGNTRIFNYKDRARLLIILRAKKLGFSLKDIKIYLDLYDVDPSHKTQSENAIKTITKRLIHLNDQRKEINFIIKELKSLKKDILESFKRSP